MAGAPRPPAGPHPGPPARPGGFTQWVKTHKPLAAAIGVVGGVGLVVLVRRANAANSAAGVTTTPSTYNPGSDPGLYGYGSGSYGGYTGDMGGVSSGLSGSTVGSLPGGTTGSVDSSSGSGSSTAAATGGATGPTDGGSTATDTGSTPPTPVPAARAPHSAKPARKVKRALRRIFVPQETITVAKGQTLLGLSERYLGTSNRTELAHANHLGTGAGLRTGQRLVVPAHYRNA